MSWLLLQLLNSTERSYAIIYSTDLLENYETILANRKVKYRCNDQKVNSGVVICISENRLFVESELKKRLEYDNFEESVLSISANWFLVQYSKGANNLIHAVVSNSEISWPANMKITPKIFVNDGNQLRLATILQVADNETKLFDEMQNLKEFCCAKLNKENSVTQSPLSSLSFPTTDIWLLVQYSCGINNIVYATINSSETVWRSENQFNDSVAYLTDGSAIYQGIIIKKSTNKDEIDEALKSISSECLKTSTFQDNFNFNNLQSESNPNIKDLMASEPKSSKNIEKVDIQTQTINNFVRENGNCNENIENCIQENENNFEKETQTDLLHHLEDMVSNLKEEAKSLSYSLKYAEIVNNQMEQRLLQLSKFS